MNNAESVELVLKDESATEALAACLATVIVNGWIYLEGELGAGKTALVRAWLRALGWGNKVKSPTFTLIEPYQWNGHRVFHLDLYRLNDPEELDYLGYRDLFLDKTLCFVEWPERASSRLPEPRVTIRLQYEDLHRRCLLNFRSATDQARFNKAMPVFKE